MQTIIILSGMFLGVGYSYLFGGFEFYTAICLFAGVFLITPVLLKFKFADFKIISTNKSIVAKNIIINFILLPISAICIGYISGDFGITGALLLLSLLAGGGMVMNWIRQSNSNIKIGFSIFFINMTLLSVSFFIFDMFSKNEMVLSLFNATLKTTSFPIEPFGVFFVLIIQPLILSRLILKFAPKFVTFIDSKKSIISNGAIFLIVFYLFGLKSSVHLMELEPTLVLKAFAATASFYAIAYLLAIVFYKNNKDDNAGFWNTITRFITIALVIATYSIEVYGYSFLLPIMIAYFIQIPLASRLSKIRHID